MMSQWLQLWTGLPLCSQIRVQIQHLTSLAGSCSWLKRGVAVSVELILVQSVTASTNCQSRGPEALESRD